MLRQENPLAQQLGGSECLMDFICTPDEVRSIQAKAEELAFAAHGGTIEATADGARLRARIVVPHAALDAFGCYYLIGSLRQDQTVAPHSGQAACLHRDFRVEQHWFPFESRRVKADGDAGTKRTLTQKFLTQLLTRWPELENVGLAVAIDDVTSFTPATFWGNSMWFLFYSRATLTGMLASLDGKTWGETLRTTAERVRRIAARAGVAKARAHGAKSAENAVVISAMGRFDRFPWFPKVNPALFIGAPTPAPADSANVFLWSTVTHHVLVVIAKDIHPIFGRVEALLASLKSAVAE